MTSTRENEVSEPITLEQLRDVIRAYDERAASSCRAGKTHSMEVAMALSLGYVRQLLASPTPPAAGGEMGEAVAWQHRLPNSRAEAWEPCSKATYDDILKWPQRWKGWEARPLYATPVAAGGVVVPRPEAVNRILAFLAEVGISEYWHKGEAVSHYPDEDGKLLKDYIDQLAAAPQQSAQGGPEVAPMAWIRFEPDLPPGEECVTFCTLPPKNPDEWIALIPAPPKTTGV